MDKVLIGPIDLLLVPIYCLLLYYVFRRKVAKNPTNELVQRYYIKGLFVKIAGAIFFGLLAQYYYGYGDTMSYYRESLIMKDAISKGQTSFYEIFTTDYETMKERFDWGAASTEAGYVVTKFGLLLSYVSFSRFLLTGALMTALTYGGIFKLFETFVAMAPTRQKQIAIFVLYFPSVVIYGSGIFKDPLCFSALGWFYYVTYQMSQHKKYSISNIAILIVSFWVIVLVKSYIIAAFMIPFSFSLVMKMVKNIRSVFLKIMAFPIMLIILATSYLALSSQIDEMLGAFAVEKLAESVQGQQQGYANQAADAGSNFEIGEMEPTMAGIAKKLPVGIVATLYRPFIWEIRKPIILASGVESLYLLWFTLLTLYKVGVFRFLKYIFTDANILLCVLFAVLFAGLVGLSTLNFGTLARYRIPVIPFYLFGVLLIQEKYLKNKKTPAPSL